MVHRFAKVLEEEIEEAFFYPSDLVNTKTTIPLRVGEERWIYTLTLRVSVYIHIAHCSHFSSPLRGSEKYYATRKISVRIIMINHLIRCMYLPNQWIAIFARFDWLP